MNNRLIAMSAAACVALAGFVVVPAWADEAQELATAGQHAGMAAGSADIKMVHMHLHHVVNCLVGPTGAGFNKAAGNPCDGKGGGAIADAGADKKAGLEAAVAKAQAGIADNSLDGAKKDASEAQAMITK